MQYPARPVPTIRRRLPAKLLASLTLLGTSTVHATTVDLIFAVDSSERLTQAGWAAETQFLSDAVLAIKSLETGATQYRFGLIRYSSIILTSHQLDSDQSLPALENSISGLDQVGLTSAVRSATDVAVDLFLEQSPPDALRRLVFLTDGAATPVGTQDPCYAGANATAAAFAASTRAALADSGAQVTIVGFGSNWNPSTLRCLVGDPDAGIFYSEQEPGVFDLDRLVGRVAVAVVPAPGAALLFASAIFGLAGLSRRPIPRNKALPITGGCGARDWP